MSARKGISIGLVFVLASSILVAISSPARADPIPATLISTVSVSLSWTDPTYHTYVQVSARAQVFEDSSRNIQVQVLYSTSTGYTGTGTGVANSGHQFTTGNGLAIFKVFNGQNQQLSLVSDCSSLYVYQVAGTGIYDCDFGGNYLQLQFESSAYASVVANMVWPFVPYDSGIYLTVLAVTCGCSGLHSYTWLPATATLQGQVSDASTGQPITTGTTITVSNSARSYGTTSTPSGSYSIGGMLPDKYTLSTSGPCPYNSALYLVTVTYPGPTTQNVALVPYSLGTLSGYVTNSKNGHGIAGATVQDTCGGRTTTTDSAGHYSFSVVSGKQIQVTASATGYSSSTQSVTVPAAGSATLNFALAKTR